MATSHLQRRSKAIRVVVLTVVLASIGFAQDSNTSDWQAEAVSRGLSAAEIQQLDADRLVVTNRSYTQIYEAYPKTTEPTFITSDSLLNAYHVLYEESILHLEQAGTRLLPDILRFVMANLDAACEDLDEEADLIDAARKRASIVVGTALKLLDDEFLLDDEAIMAIINDEVDKIVAAEVTMKPDWLGPPTPDSLSLDYTRYKVRGFYTKSDKLTRYFRAVAWLQSIPFRVAYDDELLSILILGRCLTAERFDGDTETYQAYRHFFRSYTEFLGVGDDWDLVMAVDAVSTGGPFDLAAMRAMLIAQAEEEGGPQINDQLRFQPEDPNAVTEPNFRMVSAYRLPESVLFQRTTDDRLFPERPWPNGLEVCIALGSTFAREKFEDNEKDEVLATIDENLGLFSGTSLYFEYLDAIATLLDAPEPNAPEFMASEPWQAKSCGTALTGWAQLRHTWILQAKLTVYYAGRVPNSVPPAFVEADPEFFVRMADLADRTNDVLAAVGAFSSNYLGLIDALTETADLLEEAEDLAAFSTLFWSLPSDKALWLRPVERLVDSLEGDKEARVAQLRQIAADLRMDIVDPKVGWMVEYYGADIEPLWPLLEQTSRQLESIARKQLGGVELSDDDEEFLKGYGGCLKSLMLYRGETPDTAPRIADIYSNPWTGGNLHVGIGRARALYVLYPWQGQVVLCRGAVMPYYEFVDGDRLTDTEWKARLDSDARPQVPSWLSPIITPAGLTTPASDDDGS